VFSMRAIAPCCALILTALCITARAQSNIVISQIYGGGGNTGATFRNDFIELFNRSNTAVDVSGWTIQYTSASGSSWDRTTLTGSIQPGQYYLLQLAQGNGGTTALPPADATGGLSLSATSGKVALVTSSTLLTGTFPSGSQILDFVGYGEANASETRPAAALTNTTAAIRRSGGCVDTNDNQTDFITGTPSPKNVYLH
jgi:predicted extracellular nuclease